MKQRVHGDTKAQQSRAKDLQIEKMCFNPNISTNAIQFISKASLIAECEYVSLVKKGRILTAFSLPCVLSRQAEPVLFRPKLRLT